MLIRTHILIALFFALIFLPMAEFKLLFIAIVLISSFIPDVDSRFSKLGRKKTFRLLQFFVKHRGIMHSFTFLLIIGAIISFSFPNILLPFVLGYGSHILIDGFTKQGVMPFYPFKWRMKGLIRTGGRLEMLVFVLFLILDLFLVFARIFSVI